VRRLLVALLFPLPALALSPAAKEFMAISAKLEPVQCEKARAPPARLTRRPPTTYRCVQCARGFPNSR